ncbi:oocyte-secreted protein 4B [Meriones unguiculatus]|uniref:oocyte-secreted protein 4B n=1 Tax=Meriones unguiculatus TaxID=10047 RepID=UPI00293F71F1|nr:oocyte-secreted protein 4B [Meriones unguiculatus]
MTSMCSDDWLIVRMPRKPFGNDTEVRADDIHLGNNCSVTRILSFNYEFSYPLVSCEISRFVFQGNYVLILSKIRYRPVLDLTHNFQVVCFVNRPKLPPVKPFGINWYSVSSFSVGTHVVGQQASDSLKSKTCAPDFTSSHKSQLLVKHWISNSSVKIPFVPQDREANGAQ